jgi:glutamate/tyrosine decarboxylase-like PLP-dependent enzyme
MTVSLPEQGRGWDELERAMVAMRRADLDWRGGRHAAYVWYASDDVERVAERAYAAFMVENGLGARVFPSLRQMESEVVGAVAGLLHGDEATAGHMTSGGTESIFLATAAARGWARAARPDVRRPVIVAPFSAHPGINKAAYYLGMEVVRVPVRSDHRADPAAMAAAITPDTVMIYASAPTYSLGLIDPIDEIGRLAAERGLWLHVDACVGGILAPFVRRAGYPVPPFDLELPGVTSISADLHKSGFTAKGASVLLFRDEAHQAFSRYDFEDWPSGLYSTLTFTGTRPGGAIAAAWAVMNYLGQDGYLGLARTVMEARQRFVAGLQTIDGLHLWSDPDLWAVAYGATGYDIGAVARLMGERGWSLSRVRTPPGIHLMITPVHAPVIDAYLDDLRTAADRARVGGVAPAEARAVY